MEIRASLDTAILNLAANVANWAAESVYVWGGGDRCRRVCLKDEAVESIYAKRNEYTFVSVCYSVKRKL